MIVAPIKGMCDIRRHSSNQGSVITFDMFGVRTELFIADAMSCIRGVMPVKELSLIDWQKRIDLLR